MVCWKARSRSGSGATGRKTVLKLGLLTCPRRASASAPTTSPAVCLVPRSPRRNCSRCHGRPDLLHLVAALRPRRRPDPAGSGSRRTVSSRAAVRPPPGPAGELPQPPWPPARASRRRSSSRIAPSSRMGCIARLACWPDRLASRGQGASRPSPRSAGAPPHPSPVAAPSPSAAWHTSRRRPAALRWRWTWAAWGRARSG